MLNTVERNLSDSQAVSKRQVAGTMPQGSFVNLNAVNFGELATAYRWNIRASLYAIQDLFTRDAYCAELVRNAVDFVVGSKNPIKFKDPALQRRFDRWRWSATAPQANAKDLFKFAMTSLIRDGDIMLEKVESKSGVGIRLYPMEPRYIFSSQSYHKDTQAGIRVNEELEPISYHYEPLAQPIGSLNPNESRDIPAEDVIHCFRYEWANQARGLSWLSQSYDPLRALRAFDQLIPEGAERAIKTRGYLAVPNKYFTESRVEEEDADEIALAKRIIMENDIDDFSTTKLYPDDFQWVQQNSSGITQGDVIKATRLILMERAARGLGMSSYSLSGNFSDTGVYASRQAYTLDLKFYQNAQDYELQCAEAVADWWVDYHMEVYPEWFEGYTGYTLNPTPFPYADPLRDSQALKVLSGLGVMPPQLIAQDRGLDYEQVKQWYREQAEFAKELRDEYGFEIGRGVGQFTDDESMDEEEVDKVDKMEP